MSKDPGLGGPLGSLCNILFPKKYNEKYMYQSFYHRVGYQINPSYTQFLLLCAWMQQKNLFSFIAEIYIIVAFSPIYFLIMFLTWH